MSKNAGVTTGAFYGYFSSKEALFASIVEPHAAALMGRFMEAQTRLCRVARDRAAGACGDGIRQRYLTWMVDYICQHREPVKLLLCGAEGTSYENFRPQHGGGGGRGTPSSISRFCAALGQEVPPLDRSLCHIIASGMFNSIFEVVVHDMPHDQALRDVQQLRAFYTGGWERLFELSFG